MRYLLFTAFLLVVAPVAVWAQGMMMGPEMGMMGGGMMGGMGMGGSPMDIDPVWSPNGRWIAFNRTVGGQAGGGSAQLGIVPSNKGTQDKPSLINNLRPLVWTSDSSAVICGLSGGQTGQNPYAGFWLVNRRKGNSGITLVVLGTNPQYARYAPDGKKIMLVDQTGKDQHEILVGVGKSTPTVFYSTRGGEKLLGAGWNDTSDGLWVLVEVPGGKALQPGDPIPKEALRKTGMGGMMMGGGMMGGGMMGPEMGMMGGGMMGPGGMMGGGMMGAGAQSKTVLVTMSLDRSSRKVIGEDIVAADWCPTRPLIAMRRRIVKKAPQQPGMMGPGGMGPGGMMGPEMGMMGGGMMGGMGATTTEEYMAVRRPDDDPKDEKRFGYATIPMEGLRWAPDGKMLLGSNAKERRVFAVQPPVGPIYEVAQNFDDTIKAPTSQSAAWSPDGKKIVYPGVTSVTENNENYVIRGLVIRDLQSADPIQLTANKARAMGMMGGGMMGPGMMGPGGMMR